MKNRKLNRLAKRTNQLDTIEIQVLSKNIEKSILGGSCPALTTCENYNSCNAKFKPPKGGLEPDDTITPPVIVL